MERLKPDDSRESGNRIFQECFDDADKMVNHFYVGYQRDLTKTAIELFRYRTK